MITIRFGTMNSDLVVIVNDARHERFGQLARLHPNERLTRYKFSVIYADGQEESFQRISPSTDIYYRRANNLGDSYDQTMEGPRAFRREFCLKTGKNLQRLNEEYHELFREELEPVD